MREVTSSFNAEEVEAAVRSFWDTDNIYAQVKKQHAGSPPWFFVDGPPYTTGHIHLGTAWNKILKDSILRFRRMQGYDVIDRAGYDMHGLPIEVRVEQELGFSSKKDIETYGIDKFIEKCKDFAITHKEIMSDQFRDLGIWMDFKNPYQTITPDYVEAAWWTLKRAEEKGLLERGYRVVNICPRCETAIADSEVEYWDETDPSIFVKFPVQDRENEYFVIWTTTPWTLPANVAVAVRDDFTYARVRAVKDGREEILWIGEPLVEEVLRKGRYQDFSILETVTGDALIGMHYRSPLEEQVPIQKDVHHRVVYADFVTMENTGLVHLAPGHGWDDSLVGQKEGLESLCPVDNAGIYTADAGIFAGKFVKDADQDVMDALGDNLLAKKKITHRYGHCWRCKTPILMISTEQWFLAIPKIKDKMLAEIARVEWQPDWAGSARFHDFVAGARDWCISRQRYWGIPIPVWECDACDARKVFGTVAELNEAAGTHLTDPHRPYVDDVTIPCTCGGTMHRVKDIFDVWFDSAMASWATLGFPRKTAEFERLWPAAFITEGQDQTRGWFYSQLGASIIAFDQAPYNKVLMHGFALDAEGRKMSKSVGNVISPEEVVAKVGVDVLRLYLLSASAPWDDLKFNWEGIKTTNRTINILWNVYRFPLPYMILDAFAPETAADGTWDGEYVMAHLPEMPEEDRWIISRVNSLAAQVGEDVDNGMLHRATRSCLTCILEDVSRWYVQLVRPRMWLEEDAREKREAYETMYYVMRRICSNLAPFAPHITENIFANLRTDKDPESIHMLSWFAGDATLIDATLEAEMGVIRSFDEAIATARQEGGRKLRWPIGEAFVITDSDAVENAITQMDELARQRANSQAITIVRGAWDRMGCSAEPVMRGIGPEFGKDGPKVKAAIEAADAATLKAAIERDGEVSVDGFTITEKHIAFSEKMPENIFASEMEGATVCVDITLTPTLEGVGFSREVVRRIQEMRRQLDLNVEDFITADVVITDNRVRDLLAGIHEDGIAGEVRATTLSITPVAGETGEGGLTTEWNVEGVTITIHIQKRGQ